MTYFAEGDGMTRAGLTQQSVTEAGIAANLATNPNLLPPAISELSDQAAIFASNNKNAFQFTGSADADSEATNFGEALVTKAIERVLRIEEEERKENDPAKDVGMIVELAENQRRESARYMNGKFHIDGMVLTHAQFREAIANTRARLPELARANNWTEDETREAEGMLNELEDAEQNDPERVPQILERIGRERPELREQLTTEMDAVVQRVDPSAVATAVERETFVVDEIEDATMRRVADLEIADAAGYTQPDEAVAYVERRESVRDMESVGENPFADTRASSESFNPAARGDVVEIEIAAITPTQPRLNSTLDV